ncbi:acetyl-coenzyme A synthetase [Hyaloraphidium curvatum]|nr:acetyl-coenzyme A synthetase [Hyaloraphidium curvatum]
MEHEAPAGEDQVFPVPTNASWPKAHVSSLEEYQKMHEQSIKDPKEFWRKIASEEISWFRPFSTVFSGSFVDGDVAWFHDGYLNVAYNCVDRHAFKNPDKVAIIWESDEPGQHVHITYGELLKQVSLAANMLKANGVKKGDTVIIYLPMVPEAVYAMLACARIGAVHSVVFAGFSAEALRDRIQDLGCKVVITADQGMRGGKPTHLKKITDQALLECPLVEKCIVFQRTGDFDVPIHKGRDIWWHEEIAKQRPYCPPEMMNAEDPLFVLYTSGSTGKPKGVLHTTGGYLVGVHVSTKYVFDVHEGDVFGCMADVGWITGHSYITYGPLSVGTTTVVFESIPTYPNASRYWQLVQTHKITQFYTAPTAIRALRRLGDQWVDGFDLSSLRVLGSVGEPINPEAWIWYNDKIGKGKCAIVDTYWQTEAGSIMLSPLPGAIPTKPGSATFAFFGFEPAVLDATTGKELQGNGVTGVLAIKNPWPSMARTILGDHARYLETYMSVYKGYYFTGDGVTRDKDGYYWIRGRVDDVINVSGHRLSTAEIESALILHPACAEAAVIGVNDDVTGQAIFCFVSLKGDDAPPQTPHDLATSTAHLKEQSKEARDAEYLKKTAQSLIHQVRSHIGPFASPKRIVIVGDLPKTRSGKIMRRVLRKIANGDVTTTTEEDMGKLGDLSTLSDPGIVPQLIQKVHGLANGK